MASRRFPCTAGGAIARGRRRLRWLLWGLTGLMLASTVAVWGSGRVLAGLVPLAVAAVPWTAWRMSGDLDVLFLELEGARLTVRTRRRRFDFDLGDPAGARARPLDAEERAHLERLASTAGLTAGSGGFDSRRLGEFELHASDLANAVLIESGDLRLVLTPDSPAEFCAALRTPASPG